MPVRDRARFLVRSVAVALVVAWFLAEPVRSAVPFWLPFAILVAGEAEFLVRGLREWRRHEEAQPRPDRGPGAHDADLGWGELVEDAGPDGTVGIRWIPPPPRPPRPRSRRLYPLGVVVVAGVFYAALQIETSDTWDRLPSDEQRATERLLTQEAGRIAGRTVSVRCDAGYAYTGTGTDVLGVAFPRRGLAYLDPAVCRVLHDVVAADPPRPSTTVAESILVLAHEAVHLAGETREGVTECLGLQEGVSLGERLGFTRKEALAMMRGRYEANLAERSITRITYRLPAGCRDAGELDLRPGDAAFP